MKRFAAILAAALACIAVSAPAQADERINDYKSDVTVARNGALTVTETITVTSEGERIVHGIYRDFPTPLHRQIWPQHAHALRRDAGSAGWPQRGI